MFYAIFLFEVRNRLRRPAVYLYFLAILAFTVLSFSTGGLPVGEKEHINSPFVISFFTCVMTMFLMLVSSSLMGMALFRDIEYQTKDYYLTYPITKPGYFWGRFFGSFLFMILITLAIPLGILIGTHLGPAIGKTIAAQYGPNKPAYLLVPLLEFGLPNILFTSALFYGLVGVVRNVKVIYFGGALMCLFYFMSLFFLNNTTNETVTAIVDPFALSAVRFQKMYASYLQKNGSLVSMRGALLVNRFLWPGLGVLVLLATYAWFNFENFFAGWRDKAMVDESGARPNAALKTPALDFSRRWSWRTLRSLVGLELTNIVRDNYFWVIVGAGAVFLGFMFWLGGGNYGVEDLRRTVGLLANFADGFPFFMLIVIMFYTGETLQRDRLTRYAFINDSLPPANWVLNASKLISILVLAIGISFFPMVVGIIVQLLKGYTHLNIAGYLTWIGVFLMPKMIEGALFCYLIQVVFNNKFVGYVVTLPVWVGLFFLDSAGIFDYHLILYSFIPSTAISDMDGMGRMVGPDLWFQLYWLLGGALLIVVAALLYVRGVSTSFRERLQLVRERFTPVTLLAGSGLLVLFLAVGGWIYYNISYENEWLTKGESLERSIRYEKSLKKYERLPIPRVVALTEWIDLYPAECREEVRAKVTLVNKTRQPLSEMLLDGDELTTYTLAVSGKVLAYSSPLLYPRGKFSWFRPKFDTAEFRLYQLPKPVAPGDTLVVDLQSEVAYKGFRNSMYAPNLLENGTIFNGGLPGLGYDDDDEVGSPYERAKAGLPPKVEEDAAQDDPVAVNTLKAGYTANLMRTDITVSTEEDQMVVSHGDLVGQWSDHGRRYFHYVSDSTGMYQPFIVLSARYLDRHERVTLDHPVDMDIYYEAPQGGNLDHYLRAFRDGLRYYSVSYGPFPFKNMRLAETSNFSPWEGSMATMDTYAEPNGWNAHFTDPDQYDYLYVNAARNLAQQWWRFQVAPANTAGAFVIPEGLANYDALVMAERYFGKANMRPTLSDQMGPYFWNRRGLSEAEHPLLLADQWFEWSSKAGLVMYGLRELMGEDSLNAVLRDFRRTFAFREDGPFAGAGDLYRLLKRRAPDSIQYYLEDSWRKVTIYDNRVVSVSATKTGQPDEYKVTMRVHIDKHWEDGKGNDVPATAMNDYIDIGVMGADRRGPDGVTHHVFLSLKRYCFTRGDHEITMVVRGLPKSVGVDPLGWLIDANIGDNIKQVE